MTMTKFGGAVLRTPEGFRAMVDILRTSSPGVVVVSAFASTTRNLETAARTAASGIEHEAEALLQELMAVHYNLISALIPDSSEDSSLRDLLTEVESDLKTILGGVAITRQLTPRTLDRILAYGELMALHIARHVIKVGGMDATWCDATTLVVTTDTHGAALPLTEKSQVRVDKILRPLLKQHQFVLVQGFVGATESGTVTTMGRESSNLSATFLASLLGATEINIWTDVEGIRTGDPALMTDTQLIPSLSYRQANIAARHGVKLLFATMIEPAERAGIPIYIGSVTNRLGGKTVISADEGTPLPIVAIHDAYGDSMRSIDIIFVNPNDWLNVLASSMKVVNHFVNFYVISNPTDRSVTISLDANDAVDLSRLLHTQLQSH